MSNIWKTLSGGGANPSARLVKIKSIFTKALVEAQKLSQDLAASIETKSKELETLRNVKDENDRFMSNLEGLVH
jgi:hypothetical protein